VHSLSTSFVLGFHGCDRETGERLLLNQPFQPSENSYDWLGSGIYFWEANPDRAWEWAKQRADRILKNEGRKTEPFVVGAVVESWILPRSHQLQWDPRGIAVSQSV